MEIKDWKCDGNDCEKARKDSLNWWMLSQDRQDGTHFAIAAFNEKTAREWQEHFCGTKCLFARIESLMQIK